LQLVCGHACKLPLLELDVFLGLPQIDMLPFGINISIFCVNASDGLHVRFITLMNILLILGI
jgi:hypothetical protein